MLCPAGEKRLSAAVEREFEMKKLLAVSTSAVALAISSVAFADASATLVNLDETDLAALPPSSSVQQQLSAAGDVAQASGTTVVSGGTPASAATTAQVAGQTVRLNGQGAQLVRGANGQFYYYYPSFQLSQNGLSSTPQFYYYVPVRRQGTAAPAATPVQAVAPQPTPEQPVIARTQPEPRTIVRTRTRNTGIQSYIMLKAIGGFPHDYTIAATDGGGNEAPAGSSTATFEPDYGFGGGLAIGTRLNAPGDAFGMRFELEGAYRTFDIDEADYRDGAGAPVANNTVHGIGRLDIATAMANAYLQLLPKGSVSPFIGIGAGGAYHEFKSAGGQDAALTSYVSSNHDGWDPAVQGMAGAEIRISDNLSVVGEYKHLFIHEMRHVSTNGDISEDDFETDEMSLGLVLQF